VSLNREKVLFLVFLAIFAWSLVDYIFRPPSVSKVGEVLTTSNETPLNIDSNRPLPEIERFVSDGRDFFVPKILTAIIYKRQAGQKTKPEPKRAKPKSIDKGENIFLPPKPSKKKVLNIKKAAANEKAPYKLPVEVKGFLESGNGVLQVLVVPVGGGDYFTLSRGDEWQGISVVALSNDNVIFENEEGKRFSINKQGMTEIKADKKERVRGDFQNEEKSLKHKPESKKKRKPSSKKSDLDKGIEGLIKNIGAGGKITPEQAASLVKKMGGIKEVQKKMKSLTPEQRKKLIDLAIKMQGGF
jgi:hypothetical protein